ncbi:MAG: hypothetical protein ACREEM_49215 [Blastocatellia bacterium]
MSQTMTLELTDEIYEAVKKAASETGVQPVEWVLNNLRHHFLNLRPGSPQAVLWAMSQPPHLNPADVDELERVIKEGQIPINWEPLFEDSAEKQL